MNKIALATMLTLLAGCGTGEAIGSDPAAPGPRSDTATTSINAGGKLDGLTLTFEIDRTTLEPLEEAKATLRVENNSGETITDPGCWAFSTSNAIVPVDDPSAELWLQVIVDCAGPSTMPDGHEEENEIERFPARTMTGDPLPPGDYVAALEVRGFSERLEVPVTVVEGD